MEICIFGHLFLWHNKEVQLVNCNLAFKKMKITFIHILNDKLVRVSKNKKLSMFMVFTTRAILISVGLKLLGNCIYHTCKFIWF